MTARPLPSAARRYVTFARPTFLYVMYAVILWAIPLGLLGAVRPAAARAMTEAMTAYFAGLPQPLYTLFGAAYLGYTAARQWGKAKGTDQ
ncbi:3TM-type holin [Novosphingobium sp.]|uniref:3TM-type holin n=1 Tax=Novosphingobium sp. TaxID=1874826 RepID=UPI003BAC73B2